MPYIKSDDGRREKLQQGDTALNAGELNYQIFYHVKYIPILNNTKARLELEEKIKLFVKQFLGEKPNYQRYNDMTGVLVRCYKEIKRRIGIDYKVLLNIMNSYDDKIAIYEDIKIKENGDV